MVIHPAYRTLSRLCRAIRLPPQPAAGQRVLLYHGVGTKLDADDYGTSMDPHRFQEQMDRLALLRGTWKPAPFGAPRADRLEAAIVFDDGYRETLLVAAPLLMERDIPFTVFVTAGFVKLGSPRHLSLQELKRLAAVPGAHIGAHGFSHTHLDRADDATLARELADSRKFLEDAIGKAVVSMSYPHGGVDRRVASAAKAAGFVAGGTSRYGLNEAGRDPLLLCRTEIVAWDTADDFELKLRGHWDWYRYRHADPAS